VLGGSRILTESGEPARRSEDCSASWPVD
jgi:hypothetical protein